MANPFDPAVLFATPYDVPDLASLEFPWSTPASTPQGSDPSAPLGAAPLGSPGADPSAPLGAAPGGGPQELHEQPVGGPAAGATTDFAPPPPPPITELPSFTLPPPGPQLPAVPPPDALSSAGGTPEGGPFGTPTLTPEQQYGQAAKKLTESPFDPATGDLRADVSDADAQRYLSELAQRDPQKFVEVSAQLEDIKTKRGLAEKQRIVNEDWARQQDNHRAYTEAMKVAQARSEQLVADAQRIADTKMDPTGGLSGGGALAGALGAIVGGLVQGRTGAASNAGMDALNNVIARGIDAQKADLANQREGIATRRSLLADEVARHGDVYHAAEALRLAALKHADDQLAIEQQKYSPRGTTFGKIANLRAQVAAAQQQAIAANKQKDFENDLKKREQKRKEAETESVIAKNRAEAAKLAAEATKAKKIDQVLTPQQIREQFPKFPASAIPASGATLAELTKRNELANKGQELEQAAGKNALERTIGDLKMKDGSAFIPKGTEASITKLREKHDSAVALVRTLDAIRRVGPEWLSDTANSDKLQQLQQLMGDATLQAIKAKDLGVPTGHDIELAQNFVGTTDPTRRKDSLAGLIQSRASIVRDHSVTLENAGLDTPWTPDDTSNPPKPKRTPRDEERAAVLGKSIDIRPGPYMPGGELLPPGKEIPPPSASELLSKRPSQAGLKVQRDLMDKWAADLAGDDEAARKQAADDLGRAAKESPDEPTREYAQKLLFDNVGRTIFPPLPREEVR